MEAKLSFDSFTKKIYIKASAEKLYWCWATAEGICSWFLRKADYTTAEGDPRPAGQAIKGGDRYHWEWHNWDGHETGEILEANGRDHLVFSFAGESKVSVDLLPKDDLCLLQLRQYDIPTDDENKLNIHHGCSNGWTFWLANLKAWLEHGILLNETEEDLTKIPLAGFEFVNM